MLTSLGAVTVYRTSRRSFLRSIMDQNLFRHAFSWFGEYDPLAVCWALAGPEDDDEDDDEDSYSRGGDLDDDDEDADDDDDDDEDQAGTLWARRQVRQRS